MRKFVWLVMFMFLLVGTARAELLGISQYMGYPDIVYDNTGNIKYDPDGDINNDGSQDTVDLSFVFSGVTSFNYNFVLDADDMKIAYSNDPTDVDYLSDNVSYLTDMKVYLNVDSQGNLMGSGYMVERVTLGSVNVKGNTYTVGDVILAGEVVAFGWTYLNYGNIELGFFDFIVSQDSLTGKLIDDGIWPDYYPTGLFVTAEDIGTWTGSWDIPFTINKVKGDKAPIPEPATLLLVGAGLVSIGFFGRRRIKK